MSHALPPTSVDKPLSPSNLPPNPPNPKPRKPTNAFAWLSVLLLGLIAAMVYGFLQYQQPQKPKVQAIARDGVIQKIQTLNRLQTVAYQVDTVIKAEKQGNWYALWQDQQKALFIAHGRVQAGIDLNQLKPEQVEVSPLTPEMLSGEIPPKQQVTITLPPAQIFETYLDNLEVYDIDTGLFNTLKADPQIFSQAQAAGKQQVLASACRSDILKLATDNAQKQVKALFGLANVEVTVKTVTAKSC